MKTSFCVCVCVCVGSDISISTCHIFTLAHFPFDHIFKNVTYPFRWSFHPKKIVFILCTFCQCFRVEKELFPWNKHKTKLPENTKWNPYATTLYITRTNKRIRIGNKPKQILLKQKQERKREREWKHIQNETTIFPNDEKTNIKPEGIQKMCSCYDNHTESTHLTNTEVNAVIFFRCAHVWFGFFFSCSGG